MGRRQCEGNRLWAGEDGKPVTISVDAYPQIEFRGEVVRLGEAATSQFALLPSPNPSGNFTKITQRLPIRVAIKQRDGLLRPE
jgi:membrane fusion protein (multidrug efflux system)